MGMQYRLKISAHADDGGMTGVLLFSSSGSTLGA